MSMESTRRTGGYSESESTSQAATLALAVYTGRVAGVRCRVRSLAERARRLAKTPAELVVAGHDYASLL